MINIDVPSIDGYTVIGIVSVYITNVNIVINTFMIGSLNVKNTYSGEISTPYYVRYLLVKNEALCS